MKEVFGRRYRVVLYMAWWWPFYSSAVIFVARSTGMTPDVQKLAHVAQLALRTRMVAVKAEAKARVKA